MTLHKLTDALRKFGIWGGIGSVVVILLIILFNVGIFIKNIVFPPQVTPPNETYGELTPIQFPENVIEKEFSYTLNTITGTLPDDFPDRLNVYPITKREPSLLNLNKTKDMVESLDFTDKQGKVLPESALGNSMYEWQEVDGIRRKIRFNTVTFDFDLQSQYASSLTVLGAQHLSDQVSAIEKAKDLLGTIDLFPDDVWEEPEKAKTQLFSINRNGGGLTPTTSLSSAQVIRVNFYQKNIAYDLDLGRKDKQVLKMDLPVMYSSPPYSTMSFWIASGEFDQEVVEAKYVHQAINTAPESIGTYSIKTADQAYEELKNGQGYIASYFGLDGNILINNIYLAYYLGVDEQDYLMPIVVFEGQNDFIAYVPALKPTTSN